MSSVFFHLLLIPGVFLLGWLSHSVKVAGFHVKERYVRESSN